MQRTDIRAAGDLAEEASASRSSQGLKSFQYNLFEG
jgi:hypothetical protein